jgi:hypothetical protein
MEGVVRIETDEYELGEAREEVREEITLDESTGRGGRCSSMTLSLWRTTRWKSCHTPTPLMPAMPPLLLRNRPAAPPSRTLLRPHPVQEHVHLLQHLHQHHHHHINVHCQH